MFLSGNGNDNVIKDDLFKFYSMSIIDEEKQSNAESARLSGRPYKY
jgi:hypothetical protein